MNILYKKIIGMIKRDNKEQYFKISIEDDKILKLSQRIENREYFKILSNGDILLDSKHYIPQVDFFILLKDKRDLEEFLLKINISQEIIDIVLYLYNQIKNYYTYTYCPVSIDASSVLATNKFSNQEVYRYQFGMDLRIARREMLRKAPLDEVEAYFNQRHDLYSTKAIVLMNNRFHSPELRNLKLTQRYFKKGIAFIIFSDIDYLIQIKIK